MKKPDAKLLYLFVLGVIAWGLITPSGLRAAAANNAWSIAYLKYHYDNLFTFPNLYTPPAAHANASVLLAYQAMNHADFNLASQYVNRLVESSHPFALNTYAQFLYLQGDYLGAFELWKRLGNITRLEQAAGEFQEKGNKELVVQAYQSLYEIQPETYSADLADKLSANQNYPAAIAILQQAVHDYPGSTQKSTWLRLLGSNYRIQGNAYQAEQNWLEAESAYRQALDANSMDSLAWRDLGWMYYEHSQDVEQAIACFNKVIEIEPLSGEGYINIGSVLEKEKEYPEALQWYKKAIDIAPEIPGYRLAYAKLLRDANQLDLAIETFEEILSQFPDDAILYYEIAQTYLLNNQPDQAIQAVEKALELSPEYVIIFNLAGQLYEQSGFLEKAIMAYQGALSVNADDPTALQGVERLSGSR